MPARGSRRGEPSQKFSGEGLCPQCGGLGVYSYVVRLDRGDEGNIVVEYEFSCTFCGYNERSRVVIPVRAAYYLRFLFKPEVMVYVEKMWHLLNLKARLGECVGRGCEGE